MCNGVNYDDGDDDLDDDSTDMGSHGNLRRLALAMMLALPACMAEVSLRSLIAGFAKISQIIDPKVVRKMYPRMARRITPEIALNIAPEIIPRWTQRWPQR